MTLVGSCSTPASVLSPTASPLPSPTVTIAFPTLVPTSTWTPGPVPSPTAGSAPGLGALVLYDTFDGPGLWELTSTSTGAASIDGGRLTLAVRTPGAYHLARRAQPDAEDFYAAVDTYPQVCNPQDEYGLTVRTDALGEYYRFMIGCDGTARISRVLEDGSRALTLRIPSLAIIAGAPTHNRLEVWAEGLDLKLAVNGTEVASVRDAALRRGTFGLLARAGQGGQITVSFDNLSVRGLVDASPTPHQAATASP
jgi:hypothetical protein